MLLGLRATDAVFCDAVHRLTAAWNVVPCHEAELQVQISTTWQSLKSKGGLC